ncbi:hypothetical protein A0H81_01224 [Grifola frondosa]|uniref:Uncharacterized protein n=1 Tax=Grifola frondosa TaxID=5627 RepID=A0A1C7MRP3_GRIFR|nr:hypothetical protein A0H81_01224 [Grifola frondosa]
MGDGRRCPLGELVGEASASAPHHWFQRAATMDDIEHAEVTMFGAAASPDYAERKAQLQAAKEYYREEKERYRKERELRRQRRHNASGESERKDGPSAEPAARTRWTSTSTSSRAIDAPATDHQQRARRDAQNSGAGPAQAVTRRLSDMGFTTSLYPSLPGKVVARLPAVGEVSKERRTRSLRKCSRAARDLSPQESSGIWLYPQERPGPAWGFP